MMSTSPYLIRLGINILGACAKGDKLLLDAWAQTKREEITTVSEDAVLTNNL